MKETLSSAETLAAAEQAALTKTKLGTRKTLVLAALAGAYIAIGGTLSLLVGYGFAQAAAGNPGLQKLLSGAMFPLGLILVVLAGAELFTGNNAVLIPGALGRRYPWKAVARNWALVYLGNFAGALLFAYFFVYLTGAVERSDPEHRSGQSIHAVARRTAERHRRKLARMSGRVARHVLARRGRQDSRPVVSRHVLRRDRLRTQHRQHVLHSAGHDGASSSGGT